MAEKRFFTDIVLGTDNLLVAYGTGLPESSQTADVASLYLRSDATDAGDSLYIKNAGTGDTGWLQVATMSSGATTGDIMFVGSDGNLQHDGDTDFVWDSTNNRLGINTASPDVALHLFSNTAGQPQVNIETTTTTNSPTIQFQFDSTGTRAASIAGAGVSSFATPGIGTATELWFYTRPSGSQVLNMILASDGNLNLAASNELRLWNSTGWTDGDYIGITASGATATITYILPDAVGSSGQYLELDNSGTGQLIWSTPADGGATVLDELLDVEVDNADDGDFLIFEAGSLNAWRATSSIVEGRIHSPYVGRNNNYPLVVINELEGTLTDHGRDTSEGYLYSGEPGTSGGGQLIAGSNKTISGISFTGTNLSGSAIFQELAGGFIIWQSYGVSGTLDSPVAVADAPGAFAVYKDSDDTGQAQSYGYFQAGGHNGSSYLNSCILGAFYDKDGPALVDATGGALPGKWILATSNGINEGFPQPALSVYSNKTVEVVRGTFRIRLGNSIQLWNTLNDSYVSLRSPDFPVDGSSGSVDLILPDSFGLDGQVLTADGTGVMTWEYGNGPFIKAIGVENPTSSEDITLFYTDDSITITQINSVLRGTSTPSVTWTMRYDSDRNVTGTEIITGGTITTSRQLGDEDVSFDNSVVPAGSWIWIETSAVSGTADEINITIEYTRD